MGGQFSKRRSGFEMLERSHHKIAQRLAELCEHLQALANQHRSDDGSIDDTIAFFQHQVIRHEEDEEKSLFPRLAPDHALLCQQLSDEHALQKSQVRALDSIWQSEQNISKRAESALPLAQELQASYASHIKLEDQELLPLFQALPLGVQQLITKEMHERRGALG